VYAWKIHDNITSGIPDAYFSGPARDLWIEFKFANELPKQINLVTRQGHPCLSHKQTNWLDRRQAEGRNVAVVLSNMQSSIILINGDWHDTIDTTTQMTLSRQQVAEWITHQATRKRMKWETSP
jgi:hypothetical protein